MNIVKAVAFPTLFQIIELAFLPVSQLQIYTVSPNDAIIGSTSYSCMLSDAGMLFQTRHRLLFCSLLYQVGLYCLE